MKSRKMYFLTLIFMICVTLMITKIVNKVPTEAEKITPVAHASTESPKINPEVMETLEPPISQISETPAPQTEAPKTPEISEEVPKSPLSDREREMLAKLLYGEANSGCVNTVERSMVVWCVFNRVDAEIDWFGKTIENIIAKPGQFTGYHENAPVTKEDLDLVDDVALRWAQEKSGQEEVGRTLPGKYLFFVAEDGPGWGNKFYCWSTGGLGGSNAYQVWYDYKNPVSNPY